MRDQQYSVDMRKRKLQQSIAEKKMMSADHLFGESIVSQGLIKEKELAQALEEQSKKGGLLGEVLVRLEILSEEEIAQALAEYLSMEYYSFDDISKIDKKIARMLPETIAKRFCLIAIGEEDGKVVVAMADPLNVIEIDTISLRINRPIKVVISSEKKIYHAIEEIYHGSDVEEQSLRDLVELEVETEASADEEFCGDGEYNEEAAAQAPVIRFVDLLLSHAIKSRASDIHIEPQERSMIIRMRVDGVLRDMVPPPRSMQAAVITRIKILSEMDIAERRLPQDGRFKIKTPGKSVDIRVSVIPIIYGEKAVLRILDPTAVDLDLNKLGIENGLLQEFKNILAQPNGIIVVTGPTGSGKSTTLYSVLNYLKDPTKNITTVENPVEYRLSGINQIQIKPEIDLDFAKSLRAILRQDPDIILIGEIRDKETVEIAIKASLTGHLVLSTFHTNDAPSAISRMIYMGIEPYLLASTLNLVIAQRLVRRICEHCKEPTKISEKAISHLSIDSEKLKNAVFYHGKGCKACGGTGYLGRLPVFEFLVINNEVREKLFEGANESEVKKMMDKQGYGGLLESGVSKILQGLTTPEEVLNVTYMENTKEE